MPCTLRPLSLILARCDSTVFDVCSYHVQPQVDSLVALYPSPDNVVPVDEVVGKKLDGVFIGACTTAEEDLILAALVLKVAMESGLKPVATGQRRVTPGSVPIVAKVFLQLYHLSLILCSSFASLASLASMKLLASPLAPLAALTASVSLLMWLVRVKCGSQVKTETSATAWARAQSEIWHLLQLSQPRPSTWRYN